MMRRSRLWIDRQTRRDAHECNDNQAANEKSAEAGNLIPHPPHHSQPTSTFRKIDKLKRNLKPTNRVCILPTLVNMSAVQTVLRAGPSRLPLTARPVLASAPARTRTRLPAPTARTLTTSAPLASGHSRWSKIRHKKGAVDAQRGGLFSRLMGVSTSERANSLEKREKGGWGWERGAIPSEDAELKRMSSRARERE